MIYLDNGATTFPKPASVVTEVNNVLKHFSANPGRGGHKMAIKASEIVYNTRIKLAEMFKVSDPSNVIFTNNCTNALNTVIKGVLMSGDHVIISSLEHNAVLRPIEKLRKSGVSFSIAEVAENDSEKTVNNFRDCIQENTKLVICTAASNVFGIKPPFERICALCHQYGILTCVDAAQGGGVFDFNLSASSIDYLCLAGHKGLYGPMGTGVLIINCDTVPDSLTEGGTGSNSADYNQPLVLPDRFESGTVNCPGIAGLGAGIDFINKRGVNNIYRHELNLVQLMYSNLKEMDKVELYTDYPKYACYAPVISFNAKGRDCEEIADVLSEKYNIAVRAGLHCAPLAHKSMNTFDRGTVRAVPSIFTTKQDIYRFISALYKIIT
ncbi:MAG: aminotransferase class V-fold PLP-dependent enzyme [Ruminococcus sp.]|nr:aminotransferase class V-fold PLP-dependent enzyme [Ruminococcus sp.]